MKLKVNYLSAIWNNNKGLFLGTLLCAIVRSIILLIPSYLVQYIYENAIQQRNFELLIKLCFISIVIPIMTGGLIILDMKINGYILRYFVDVRNNLFHNLVYREYGEFAKLNSGSVIYKILIKTDKVANYYYFGIGNIVWYTATIFVGIFLCWMENDFIAVGIVTVSILKIVIARIINNKIKKYADVVNKLSEKQCSFIDDVMNNYLFIKSSGIEEEISEKYKNFFKKRLFEIKKIEFYKMISGFWQCLSTVLLNGLLYLFGGSLIIRGQISIGILLSIISIVSWIAPTFEGYLDVLLQFAQNRSDEEIINSFQSDKITVYSNDSQKVNPPGYEIVFEKTAYRYPEASINILKDINLEIKERDKLCFIGNSGCGKSTAIDLISGLLYPTEGRLLIGGVESNRIKNTWLRENIAIASQNGYIFKGTVAENIFWGSSEKNLEKIGTLLEMVCMREWIKKQKNGINSYIDENSISGGEKQRILLARLLCRKANIYIFDEATSALDENTEKRVINNLCKFLDTATLIFITHRKTVMYSVGKTYSFPK